MNNKYDEDLKKTSDGYEKQDYRRFWDYLKLGDVNTNAVLMLSELVDNSISSFENYFNSLNKEWTSKTPLKIKIKIGNHFIDKNFTNEELEEIIPLGRSYKKESYILFEDNGFGMDAKKLASSLSLNSLVDTKSSMNVHGRGLKQCVYYFGTDYIISSINLNKEESYIENIFTKESNVNSKYKINVKYKIPIEEIEKRTFDTGTRITISNIYKTRLISENSFKGITELIYLRYIKYMEEELIKIEFDYTDISEVIKIPSENKEDNSKYAENKSKVSSIFSKNDIDFLIKELKKKERNNITNQKSQLSYKTAIYEIIKILQESKTNSLIEFKFEVPIELNNRKTNFKFWHLPKEKGKQKNGLRLYEDKRAVYHSSLEKNTDVSTYKDFRSKETLSTGGTALRFAGEGNMKELGIRTSSDKSKFDMSDHEKDLFNNQIVSIWNAFNDIILLGRKEEKYEDGKNLSDKILKNLPLILHTKFNNENIIIKPEEFKKTKQKIEYKDQDDNKWEINFFLKKDSNPSNMFDSKVDRLNFIINLTIYTGNHMWKKIDKSNDFFTELLFPMTILLVVSKIEDINNKPFSFEEINVASRLIKGN